MSRMKAALWAAHKLRIMHKIMYTAYSCNDVNGCLSPTVFYVVFDFL